MKRLYLLLAVLLLAGCVTTSGYTRLPDQITEWLEHNVWRVDTSVGGGTGFWINDVFVTACHLVNKVDTALIYNTDRSQLTLTKTASCDLNIADITILTPIDSVDNNFNGFEPISIKLADEMPRPGTFVYSAGWEMGGPPGFTTGVLNRKVDIGYEAAMYMVPGDSGSPVLVLYNGQIELIGILRGFYSTHHPNIAGVMREISILGSSMFHGVETIRDTLEKHKARKGD